MTQTHIVEIFQPLVKIYINFLETIQVDWSEGSSWNNEWEFGALDISNNSNKYIGCGF